MHLLRATALVVAAFMAAALPGRADLLTGTQLTGSLQFGTSGNLFNPSTLTLNSGDNLFNFSIPTVNNISADLNISAAGDTLTLTDNVLTGQWGYGWTQTFTDAAFANFNPILVSSSFSGLNLAQNGTTWTLTWTGTSGPVSQSTAFKAVYNLVDPPAAPEPSAFTCVLAGFVSLAFLARRRRQAQSSAR